MSQRIFPGLRQEIESHQASGSYGPGDRALDLKKLSNTIEALRVQLDGGPGPKPGASAIIDDAREQIAGLLSAASTRDLDAARDELGVLLGFLGTYITDAFLQAQAADPAVEWSVERPPVLERSRKEGLHLSADALGEGWGPPAVEEALRELEQDGIVLDPRVESPETIAAVISAAAISPPK